MNRHAQQLHRPIQFGFRVQVAGARATEFGQHAGVSDRVVDFVVAITFSEDL